MNTLDQVILAKISHLSPAQKQRVLAFIEEITTPKHYTARELMRLPIEERNGILLAQLERAADEDFETFEAYSEEELDV